MIDKKGWISIHRKLQKHWLWQDKPFSQGQAWIDILLECNHEKRQVAIKNIVLVANRGESLNSLQTWSKRFGWNISATWRFLKKLQKAENIDMVSETVTTRLTVCNYDTYQIRRNADETQMKRKRNASEMQAKTNNKIISKQVKNYSDTILQIVRNFYNEKSKQTPLVKSYEFLADKQKNDSCDTIDKLNRIDKIPFDTIRAVVMRSIKDEFWQNQILSLRGLRTRSKNKEMKFTNAYASLLSDYRPAAPKKELIAYRYDCPSCEKEYHPREFIETEAWNCYRCTEPGCQKIELAGGGNIGYELIYVEEIYKDIS